MSVYRCELKAAISLSNSGVALLERHCYRSAMECLSDAVSVMKKVVDLQESPPILPQKVPEETTQQKLQKAAHHISTSAPSSMALEFDLKVLSDAESPSVLQQELFAPKDNDNIRKRETLYLVRMEPDDFQDSFSNEDLPSQAATILYNYGVAYHCLSFCVSDSSDTLGLIAGTLKLSHLAYITLSAPPPTHATYRELLITALCLQTLVKVSHLLGFGSDSLHYAELLAGLHPSVFALHLLELEFQSSTAPAA